MCRRRAVLPFANAARRAGLGQHYQSVPFREDPAFDEVRKHGIPGPGVDDWAWHEPSTWWAPPEHLRVDVDRTIQEGRIVAASSATNDASGW
jgi:hypothetical protein